MIILKLFEQIKTIIYPNQDTKSFNLQTQTKKAHSKSFYFKRVGKLGKPPNNIIPGSEKVSLMSSSLSSS